MLLPLLFYVVLTLLTFTALIPMLREPLRVKPPKAVFAVPNVSFDHGGLI